MAEKLRSNYLGNGKRYNGAHGTDVAVSRGPAGEWMYDFEPMRRAAERYPGHYVRFWCQRNSICIAGIGEGPVIDLELGANGYLTKPVEIWYSSETVAGD